MTNFLTQPPTSSERVNDLVAEVFQAATIALVGVLGILTVAANQAIGDALARLCKDEGFVTRIPPPGLCTDNATMIAWVGVERLSAGGAGDALSTSPRARWPLAGTG